MKDRWWIALGWALGMGASGASAQQIWKCEVDGQVRFSDKPCPGAGQRVPERALQPNVVDSLKPEVVREAMGRPAAASSPAPAAPAGNACPGDGEIRGMETRASSTTMGDPERQFMQDEVRRARQCRAGRGRYTEADWAVSRAAQAAQTQISDRARLDARLRAEAMHSAADPEEADRIARRRIAEERLQRRQQEAWQRGQNAASAPRL
ncbi:MAG: hypothetical protein EKK53_09105 [Burkholderiales bacterium]|nr:MAG: hypothetical protein EKK53_09105 [Burkholderiales bacterium]